MRVLITGGTGIIGSITGRKLAERGNEVRLLDVRPSLVGLAGAGSAVEVVRGDVLSFGDVGEAARGVDAIIHLAYTLGTESNKHPQSATNVNVVGTVNVLEVARLLGVPRVLMASSVAVYGCDEMYPSAALPLREDAATHIAPGMPVYGAGKLYLEKLAEVYRDTYDLFVAGVRPSVVYGPGGRRGVAGWIATLVEQIVLGKETSVRLGDAAVSLVYVEDVAEQLAMLTEIPADRCDGTFFFNTGGDRTVIREMAEVLRDVIPEAEIDVTSNGERDVSGLPTRVSGDRLAQVIGYDRKYPLDSGLRHYIDDVRGVGQRPTS